MATHLRRRSSLAISVLGAALLLTAAIPAEATSSGDPSLRLIAPLHHISVARFKGQPAFIDPGVLLAASGGAWEVQAWRPDYGEPFRAVQVIHHPGGADDMKPLADGLVKGISALPRFLHITIKDADGRKVLSRSVGFCPDGQDQRIDASGPTTPTYPRLCFFRSPFALGTVWGIDRGWAVSAFGYSGLQLKARDGAYRIHISIRKEWVHAFGIRAQDSSVDMSMRIRTGSGGCNKICPPGPRVHRSVEGEGFSRPLGPAPTLTTPDPSTLPDLVALPAWGIQMAHTNHRDYLDFSASIWNAGPSPLQVEGYRRDGSDVMDGWQYFSKDGKVVGRAKVGTLRYDKRPGHQHWHFEQFAHYSLLDASHTQVVLSEKEAFCLAPTEAIDMTVDGADWQPGSTGLSTACGDRTSVWTREVLPAGWADTYIQTLPGQSFDITDLPNGMYFIQIDANPLGKLYERSMANNVQLRRITLGGTPGHRTVVVKPWHGIDA